uniref:NADH-ubiquinone oxidoreductase chain 5 n=1 Tax=Triaenodes qinglingensis TaxID=2904906 RepID=A0A9E8LPE7_9NEOP|nr:NADH dehydrogenase subunit 5 [Triaenodes qinglingensis]UZZ44436.1 NADH dehydrogenase subunit 5 [Triaenodes qinglingensis]
MLYLMLSFLLFLMSVFTLIFSLFLYLSKKVFFLEWSIFSINSMELIYLVLLDWLSTSFLMVVLFISSLVIFYSKSYMSLDINKDRFILMVFLFVLSMIFMIISPNLFSILLGWDGLGLVSFCLVIYFQNVKSNNSGVLTILSNRLGDGILLLLLAWMLNLSSLNFYLFYYNILEMDMFKLMGILLILISITKSAQIPFSAWLPAAMAAPTPVSALVHSSTLVTAGVYLLIRFYNLLYFSNSLKYLLLLGVVTMLMSGMSAFFEFDMKKIIALSTLSQLGLMVSTLGLGLVSLSMFHLMTHAFFKALLFLCAGSMIHSFYNFQDIRYLGGMMKYMPITFSCFMVSNLSLMGMFFMSGFYSKDLILEMMSVKSLNIFIYLIFYICVLLTLVYSIRLMFMGFLNYNNFFVLMSFHDEDKYMNVGMFGLMFMSIISGASLKWLLSYTIKFVYLKKIMKFMVLYFMFLGLVISIVMLLYYKVFKDTIFLFFFSNYMWFLSVITVFLLNYRVMSVGKMVVKFLDSGWSEYMVKLNLLMNFNILMELFLNFQKNMIKSFMLMFVMFIFFVYLVF